MRRGFQFAKICPSSESNTSIKRMGGGSGDTPIGLLGRVETLELALKQARDAVEKGLE